MGFVGVLPGSAEKRPAALEIASSLPLPAIYGSQMFLQISHHRTTCRFAAAFVSCPCAKRAKSIGSAKPNS
jgi:hypothetical protein